MLARLGLSALLLFSISGVVAGGGCKKDSKEAADTAKPTHSYPLRGIVRGARIDGGKSKLSIEHEAIPDWVNRQGQTIGMMSMTMEFEGGPKLDVARVKVGDKVAFTLDVYYDKPSKMVINKLETLPPDTALELAGSH